MHATVFFKTDAGKQEILERSRKLTSGARSILLMADGQRNETELTELIAALHAPPDTLQQLLGLGLITAARQDQLVAEAVSSKRPDVDAGMSPQAAGEKYLALYALMTETIRAHLGLKGYFMQLIVIQQIQRFFPASRFLETPTRGFQLGSQWRKRSGHLHVQRPALFVIEIVASRGL